MNKAYGKSAPARADYFTPHWAAEELYHRHLGHLGAGDLVLEPCCGRGDFLQAIPDAVEAIGVELQPDLAQTAREHTGRQVLTGDFCKLQLPSPTAIIGNPPFAMATVEAFLERAYALLPLDGFCGFILPAYCVQNTPPVLRWKARWGLQQEFLPRQLFPGLAHPLLFVTFIKGRTELFQGFALYEEHESLRDLKKPVRCVLQRADTRSAWQAFVAELLDQLGGRASLPELYACAEKKTRPTSNQWWKEKIRQTLKRYQFKQEDDQYVST